MTISDCSVHIESDSGVTSILNQVNITIPRDKVTSIIGHSGAGKSFLAKLMSCLIKNSPQQRVLGDILYQKSDQTAYSLFHLSEAEKVSYRRNEISLIFQNAAASLNPSQRCGQQIIEAIKLTGVLNKSDAKIQLFKLLEEVQLSHVERIAAAYPHQLSGGQQQRIMIAMALAKNPPILIADEPTSSLDRKTEIEIIHLLQSIQKRREMTLIFISHDLKLVQNLSDHIVVMNQGEVVEQGSTEEIFTRPKHDFTKSFLRQVATIPPESKEVKDILLSVNNASKTYRDKALFFKKSKDTKALVELTFDLRKGEIVGLIGDSGSGKSTLAKILVNIEQLDEGNIEYCKTPLADQWKYERQLTSKDIQIIFQNPLLSWTPSMTIGKALLEISGRSLDVESGRDRIQSLLTEVGLTEAMLLRFPHQVSGGELQRLSIVRALLLRPKLLICDECVSSLDQQSKIRILEILRKLHQKEQLTLLFISHDIHTVEGLCQRILYLENGRLVKDRS